MKKNLQAIIIFILCSLLPVNLKAQTHSFVGTWEGKLAVSGIELRIVFHIESDDSGLTATMDSPDQSAYDIPCGEVTSEGENVVIMVPQIQGKYEGAFLDEKLIEGTWSQGPANLPLDLYYTEEVEELNRPQEPKEPFPYEIKEVEFDNNQAGITLAGTLTIPPGDGPFPATILVSGSGPQDRDESILGHKPFWVIADYLSRNGIAVLRYDDRGFGESTGDFATATTKDFASDAKAAVDFLKQQEGVNSDLVGITGHSEGGVVAPMVAAESKDINFIVMLAGTGIVGDELLTLQTRLISEASGSSTEELDRNEVFLKNIYSVLREEQDTESLDKKIEYMVDEFIASLPEDAKGEPQNSKESILQRIEGLKSPWMRFFLSYDPVEALVKVKCPVLALNGEKDLQVPPKENLSAIEKALKKGKNKNYQVVELESLNHLFQHSDTGAPSEYAEIEETFSEEVMKLIADWIQDLK